MEFAEESNSLSIESIDFFQIYGKAHSLFCEVMY